MSIVVTVVATGEVLDRVDLVDDRLRFETGAAEDMFTAKRMLGLDDAGVYALMADWSNGYVQTRSDSDDPNTGVRAPSTPTREGGG